MSKKELSNKENWIKSIKKRLAEQDFYIAKEDFHPNPRLPYAYSKHFSGIVEKPYSVKGRGLNIN